MLAVSLRSLFLTARQFQTRLSSLQTRRSGPRRSTPGPPCAACGLPLVCLLLLASSSFAQDAPIPHGQSQPPNQPYSPAEAIERMTVPEGFHVELVAAEPDIVNPVAMTFDERGRIWVTESLEYPRMRAGTGRDRIKVLEDTDQDGRFETVTVFADDLNIPSGIAVGYGGVWVANSPDILFLQDTDGDGRADRREVVVTGFGRDDTHELPNSLVWGPDGYLYGLNGVFNRSRVQQDDKTYEFTCAMFRIDPRTHRFELFAEGTSNPWGIAWNPRGEAFLSACVIDHLWHLTETGYYHRQAGPYPPFTWKIESIVEHKHQKAAYCGIHYFDSDAYPEAYRDKLVMGNIHGNCINVDSITPRGATYQGKGHPDLLSANDAWFMPVAQKTGPDGCLYILDWYDRYHCYQDARRDPAGIDRLKGRIYRLRYQQTPRAQPFDMSQEGIPQLVKRLHAPNDYTRWTAQRVLAERADPRSQRPLQDLTLDSEQPLKTRLHALWSLAGQGPLEQDFLWQCLTADESSLRSWGVRLAANQGELTDSLTRLIAERATDEAAEVRLQVAIAAPKLRQLPTVSTLLQVLAASGDDRLIPRIVWQNLHPQLPTASETFVSLLAEDYAASSAVNSIVPRAVDRILAERSIKLDVVLDLVEGLLVAQSPQRQAAAAQALRVLTQRVQTGELTGASLEQLQARLDHLQQLVLRISDQAPANGAQRDATFAAMLLAASCGKTEAVTSAARLAAAETAEVAERIAAIEALISGDPSTLLARLPTILQVDASDSAEFRGQVLTSLGRLEQPELAELILDRFADFEASVKPKAIELMSGRATWSRTLVQRVAAGDIPASAINANQVRKMLASGDERLAEQVAQHWGTLRRERDPDREQVIAKMRQLLSERKGDPMQGAAVFDKVCGQCHKIYGKGYDVGPEITRNGRGDFEQLLSNVFDPSLVIGADYQARTVVTIDGRVETGLLAEENERRVVLRPQGGKEIVIAREDIEELSVSRLSLMPEDLEKQLSPQELADLFAFLTLDRHPSNPNAKPIPGAVQAGLHAER